MLNTNLCLIQGVLYELLIGFMFVSSSFCQGRNHAVKAGGSGWATDGARVEEGMSTVAVAAPGFSNEGWGLRIVLKVAGVSPNVGGVLSPLIPQWLRPCFLCYLLLLAADYVGQLSGQRLGAL